MPGRCRIRGRLVAARRILNSIDARQTARRVAKLITVLRDDSPAHQDLCRVVSLTILSYLLVSSTLLEIVLASVALDITTNAQIIRPVHNLYI